MRKFLIVFFIIMNLILFSQERIYKFDFGPDGSEVMDGFLGIFPGTKFTSETGYGWINKETNLGFDRKLPDALGRDFIIGSNAIFKINLPDGKYKIWILFGDSNYGNEVWQIYPLGYGIFPRDREIFIQGTSVFKDFITWQRFYSEEFFYANCYSDYKKSDNIWGKYISKKYTEKTFDVEVKNNTLEIKFRNIPLNGMIIYPESLAKKGEAEILFVNKQRKRQVVIEEIKPILNNPPMPKIKEEDIKRGYIYFVRDWWKYVYPETIPEEDEINKEVNIWASKGEPKTKIVGIYPLKDIQGVDIKVSDLKGEKGEIIKSENIEIRKARLIEKKIGKELVYKYIVVPHLFVPVTKIDLEKGITRALLITVNVPEEINDGLYQGNIEINADKNITKIPLNLKVLPIKLEKTDIAYGIYDAHLEYYWYYYWTNTFTEKDFEEEVLKHKERRYKFLRNYGLTSMAIGEDMRRDVSSPDGKTIVMNFDGGFGKLMDICTKVGFNPIVWYGFQSLWRTSRGPEKPFLISGFKEVEPLSEIWKFGYKRSIELTRDEAKKRNWSEILFYISDESSNVGEKGVKHSLEVAKVAKEVQGIRTIISSNGPLEKQIIPYVSIFMPNWAVIIDKEMIEKVKESGTELWFFNIGNSRFSYGYYIWALGAKGRFQWSGGTYIAPYDDFDGSYPDTSYRFYYSRPNDYPVATIYLEKMREGILDYRYIRTLEKLMEKAKSIKSDDVQNILKNADILLTEIKNKIEIDISKYFRTKLSPQEVGSDDLKDWNDDICDRYRWKIAQIIIELSKKVK
ncbi:MAG: DUF6067 family protein [Candidatus Omnitrophica bacterium]|nr:DUF6067 family protein [Candidatus Omnitrophota bacterium]